MVEHERVKLCPCLDQALLDRLAGLRRDEYSADEVLAFDERAGGLCRAAAVSNCGAIGGDAGGACKERMVFGTHQEKTPEALTAGARFNESGQCLIEPHPAEGILRRGDAGRPHPAPCL